MLKKENGIRWVVDHVERHYHIPRQEESKKRKERNTGSIGLLEKKDRLTALRHHQNRQGSRIDPLYFTFALLLTLLLSESRGWQILWYCHFLGFLFAIGQINYLLFVRPSTLPLSLYHGWLVSIKSVAAWEWWYYSDSKTSLSLFVFVLSSR